MGRKKCLFSTEQAQIKAYNECGMPVKDIAARMNRGLTVIYSFLKLKDDYGKKKRPGRKPKLSARDVREVKRLASSASISPAQIQRSLNLPVSKRRIQQILHDDRRFSYTKRIAKPRLLPRHKAARLQFAEKYQFWDEEWQTVIFSDEKKWNLDGPDGVQYYWHDNRRERQTRMSRNFGGGSVMVWGAFGYCGKTPICVISTRMNAEKYVELLEDVLISRGPEIGGENWIFQHDNASCHTARVTKNFLEAQNVNVLEWPACSPDLNPIENVWGMMTQRVYKNGRQFETVGELKKYSRRRGRC